MPISVDQLFRKIGRKYHENDFNLEGGAVTSGELERFHDRLNRNNYGRTGLSMDMIEYDLKRENTTERDEKYFRISMISSRLFIDEKKDSWMNIEEFEDTRKILVATDEYKQDQWHLHRTAELSTALAFEPDVICFPEFAYPPPALGRTYSTANEMTAPISKNSDMLNDYVDRSSYGRNRHLYETKICHELGGKNQPFTFLGSYHCPFDFYNIGVIFPLGGKTEPFLAKSYSNTIDDDGAATPTTFPIAPPVLYRKRFPARRIGEYARIPSNYEFHTYRVDGIHIAVMVCSDTLDLNQFFNLARINISENARDKIDLVLVPSFNKSPKLVSMCRELSFLTQSMVAFVNANQTVENFPASEIFISGFSVNQLEELGGRSAEVASMHEPIDVATVGRTGRSQVTNVEVDLKLSRNFIDRVRKISPDGALGGSGRSGKVY